MYCIHQDLQETMQSTAKMLLSILLIILSPLTLPTLPCCVGLVGGLSELLSQLFNSNSNSNKGILASTFFIMAMLSVHPTIAFLVGSGASVILLLRLHKAEMIHIQKGQRITAYLFALFKKRVSNLYSELTFPPIQKIILLIATLHFSLTMLTFTLPHLTIITNQIHECLLLVGVFNLSSFIKQRMQSKIIPHNHSTQIQVRSDDRFYHIKKSELCKNMEVFFLKKTKAVVYLLTPGLIQNVLSQMT